MSILLLAQNAIPATGDGTYFIWGCLLFGVALVLLSIEFFVPTGGLLGILCGVAAIGSIVCFFQYDTGWGVGVALAYVVLTPITLVFVFRLWLNSPVAKAMILGDATHSGEEDDAADPDATGRRRRLEELRQLIGAQGVTETALRPVGTVRINGQRTDGLAESGTIEPNTPVIVTDVYDNQIKVRPVESQPI